MNALKFVLASMIGFACACSLIIGSIIFTDTNVMIEKRFIVGADVGGAPINVNCSVISPAVPPFWREVQTSQIIVQGHGHRDNTGYLGNALVTVHRGWNPEDGRTTSGYYSMLNGGSSYRGQYTRVGNDKIAGEITGACLGNINVMKL